MPNTDPDLEIPARPAVDIVPLARALVCEDCQNITASRGNGRCGSCGSDSVLVLVKLLNRAEAA